MGIRSKVVNDLILKINKEHDEEKKESLKVKLEEIEHCDCGSYYTSNPFHHYDWCKSKQPRAIMISGEWRTLSDEIGKIWDGIKVSFTY